jgi:hypothetical protein
MCALTIRARLLLLLLTVAPGRGNRVESPHFQPPVLVETHSHVSQLLPIISAAHPEVARDETVCDEWEP